MPEWLIRREKERREEKKETKIVHCHTDSLIRSASSKDISSYNLLFFVLFYSLWNMLTAMWLYGKIYSIFMNLLVWYFSFLFFLLLFPLSLISNIIHRITVTVYFYSMRSHANIRCVKNKRQWKTFMYAIFGLVKKKHVWIKKTIKKKNENCCNCWQKWLWTHYLKRILSLFKLQQSWLKLLWLRS